MSLSSARGLLARTTADALSLVSRLDRVSSVVSPEDITDLRYTGNMLAVYWNDRTIV
jgi:hypothetical protein